MKAVLTSSELWRPENMVWYVVMDLVYCTCKHGRHTRMNLLKPLLTLKSHKLNSINTRFVSGGTKRARNEQVRCNLWEMRTQHPNVPDPCPRRLLFLSSFNSTFYHKEVYCWGNVIHGCGDGKRMNPHQLYQRSTKGCLAIFLKLLLWNLLSQFFDGFNHTFRQSDVRKFVTYW